MRNTGLLLIAGVALAGALATLFGVWHEDSAVAQPPPLVVGYDMDPAGNSCPGTGTADCTLGTIDSCVSVSPGGSFSFDVFLQGLPEGENLAGFEYWVTWGPPDFLDVTTQTHATLGVNLLAEVPGSAPIDISQEVPDADSHHVAVGDLGSAEPNPPYTRGVFGRYSASVPADTPPGTYGLTFAGGPVLVAAPPIEGEGQDLCTKYGCDLWDAAHTPFYGAVAVGVACGSPPVTVTPTPSPTTTPSPTSTVSPTSSPTPVPTGTPAPGTTPLVTGWNDSCYQGQAQTIGDAFASVMANVQAVYRMKPDQTFDRWFPARTDLSTITTLSPFDQLFILMAADAAWTVQPLAPLASSSPLNSGWNSVCYLGGGKDTAAATAGITGGFSIVYNLTPAQAWQRYVPGQPELSDLARLETFTSVLILMNEGGTWAFSP